MLREAYDYRAAHLDEAIADTAKMLKQPEATIKADAGHSQVLTSAQLDSDTSDGTVDDWFTALEGFFVDHGKIDKSVDPSTFYEGDAFVKAGQ